MQSCSSEGGSFRRAAEFLLPGVHGGHSLHGHVAVELADQLPGSMHAQDGDACVHGDDVPVGHVSGYGAAAALVNFAQFADLPYNVCFIQDCAYLAGEFCVAVVGAAFAAGTGVFYNTYAIVQEGGVLFFISVLKAF